MVKIIAERLGEQLSSLSRFLVGYESTMINGNLLTPKEWAVFQSIIKDFNELIEERKKTL